MRVARTGAVCSRLPSAGCVVRCRGPNEAFLASDDLIEIDGVIKEVFPGGAFLVETDAGTQVHAHLAGKLRRFRIRVVLGDRVTVAVSPYDLSKGRITFRHK